MLEKLRDLLAGKKTYLVVFLAAVAFVCGRLGLIDAATEKQIYTILGITLPATLHAAISRNHG